MVSGALEKYLIANGEIMNMGFRIVLAAVFLMFTGSLDAEVIDTSQHMILAPGCLVKAAGLTVLSSATKDGLFLLDENDAGIGALVRARMQFFETPERCGNFQDVTRELHISGLSVNAFLTGFSTSLQRTVVSTPRKLQYEVEVNQHLASIIPQNMWTNLITLTGFKDRYANSRHGVKAAEWIRNQLTVMVGERKDVSIYTVPTTGYRQPSVILKIGDSHEPGVVISAEMDTPDSSWWFFSRMPGAGYNGSGAVTVLEAARTLLSSDMHFKKPIYFVWYGGEMYGRRGSMDVVNLFEFQGRKMAEAVLHLECTGLGRSRTMWLMSDFADPELNLWVKRLANVYVRQMMLFEQYDDSGFSHASWTGAGVPAAMALGDRVLPLWRIIYDYKYDNMQKVSLEHMTDYLKLAIAFAVEGAQPVSRSVGVS